MVRGSLFRFLVAVAVVLVVSVANPCLATTFIVPDDAELVHKSDGIVIGVVISARAVEGVSGDVDTEYEVAVDQVLKGPFEVGKSIRISSPGGTLDGHFTHVESAAHFQIGEEFLLFLTRFHGGWSPTDMTLGKFRPAITSRGYQVLVRDAEDIVGWDRDGKVHKEKIRLEAEFLQFIEDSVADREPDANSYEVEASDVLAVPSGGRRGPKPITNLFPAPATTYSVSFFFCDGTRVPGRWPTATMNAGVQFFKNSAQNALGLGDGGVSIIQTALASWTNDCESAVNITYGGTSANLKNGGDGVNVVVFNDPGGDILGTWNGSGIIAITFSNGNLTHSFDSGTWVSMSDSDIVFQDGYAGTEVSIEEAMTHEIGHGIGLRHADRHYVTPCSVDGNCTITCNNETACDSGVEECAAVAIMTAAVNTTLNYTLQAYDMHGADALYPSTCVVVNPPTNVVATATTTTNVQVTWTASVGATSYNIYRSSDGTNFSNVGSAATTSFNNTASANTAYLYKVRAVNGGESADSNKDLATTTIFTNDPLVVGTTTVTTAHVNELRTAINAVRALASLAGASFTDTLNAGATPIKAIHINQARTALDAARSALSLSAIGYGETITATTTTIKASHVTELRNGVK
jgi:hypothetical protein